MRIDKAIAEHGPDAFQVFQLATVCSREEKFRVEDEYQRLYNSRDPEIGYNEAIPYSASRLSNFPLLGDGVR